MEPSSRNAPPRRTSVLGDPVGEGPVLDLDPLCLHPSYGAYPTGIGDRPLAPPRV